MGRKAGVLWKGPTPPEFYQKLWDTITRKKTTFTGELQNQRKNGELYWAKLSISPVLDARETILFFVGIERDITREKQIDQTKTEFVSLASHQLRTPLSAIRWFTEILTTDAATLTPAQRDAIAEIDAANHRMITLVGALLNVSRLELGTFNV